MKKAIKAIIQHVAVQTCFFYQGQPSNAHVLMYEITFDTTLE